MKYCQRQNTDCLVCCVENLLDVSRDVLPPIQYYSQSGCVTYWWAYQALKEHGDFVLVGDVFSPFDLSCRAIVGLKMPGRHSLHAVFYDGKKLFCGHHKEEVNGRQFQEYYSGVQYVIARRKDMMNYNVCDIEQMVDADTAIFKRCSKTYRL